MRAQAVLTASLLVIAPVVASGCGEDSPERARVRTVTSTAPSDLPVPAGEDGGPSRAPGEPPSNATPPSVDASATTFNVVVKQGAVTGGPKVWRATPRDPITLNVVSDAADEVHVHGIDKEFEVKPGAPGTLTFTIKDAGAYEVELHESGIVLGTFEVR